MCLCKRLHEGTLLKQTGNSRANVTLTSQRNTRDPSRHSYDTLFNRGTQARIPKHTATPGNSQSSSLTVSGLTILFGLLIISHLPQCWSNGIRGDARTLHIFGLSARTCEYEPKIQGAGGRERGRERWMWYEREEREERESSRWINVFQMGLEMRGGGVLVG